ncbi:MAG: trigger factor [Bacteroidetes bacterium]|nr:trigger factor [Bacteroidota bacterium]
MEINHQKITKCGEQVDITLTQNELLPYFDTAYKKAAKTIKMDGFRPGKAPVEIVKKLYGESIQLDSLQEIADKSFREIMKEKNISPIGTPQMTDIQFKPGDPLKFTIKYEVKPVIELKNYKKLKIEKPTYNITSSNVDEEKRRLQRIHATYTAAQKVDNEEFVATVNIKEFDEKGNEIVDRKRDGVKIYLNEESTEKEIKESLKDAEVNGTYPASFTHKHEDHEHKINLELNVTAIESVVLAEFNDEFVKKVTNDKMNSVTEFEENVKKDLENYFNDQSQKKYLDNLTQEIVKMHDIEVPESLVNSILTSFVEEDKKQYGKNLPPDFNEEKYRETLKPTATWQAKWFLLREEILVAEKITLSDEDIEKQVDTEAIKLGIDKTTLLNFYKTSDKFREKLLTDKLFDFLQKETIIVEKMVN